MAAVRAVSNCDQRSGARAGKGSTGKRLIASHFREALAHVLRDTAVCPDEADFEFIHDNMGDRETQLSVLQTNPDQRHCELWQVQSTACRSCPKNPRRNGGDRAAQTLEAWLPEVNFAQQFIRRREAGIVFSERDLLRFEAELAVAAHEVISKHEAEESLLRIPIKNLTPEQSEHRREILKARNSGQLEISD